VDWELKKVHWLLHLSHNFRRLLTAFSFVVDIVDWELKKIHWLLHLSHNFRRLQTAFSFTVDKWIGN